MKKYIFSIFFVFTAFFAKAQTVCDTVYCLFTMADTTNVDGAVTNDAAFSAFGYVEYECLSTGDAPFYRRIKKFLDLDYKALDGPYAILDVEILSDNLRTASGVEGITRPSGAPELPATQIAYGDASGYMTSSSDLVVDVSGGAGLAKVGINNATPSVALDVVGSAKISTLAGTGTRTLITDADGVISAGSSLPEVWNSQELSYPNQAAVINSLGHIWTIVTSSQAGGAINLTDPALKARFYKRINISHSANTVVSYRLATAANLVKSSPFGYEVTHDIAFDLTPTNAKLLIGLTGSVGAPTNVEPNTLTNIFGYGCLSTDTNIKLFHNDGSGTASSVDTGIARPVANQSVYRVVYRNVGSDLKAQLYVDNVLAHTATISSDIPADSTPLTFAAWTVSNTNVCSLSFIKYVCNRNN